MFQEGGVQQFMKALDKYSGDWELGIWLGNVIVTSGFGQII